LTGAAFLEKSPGKGQEMQVSKDDELARIPAAN
jgi:hypothetical protein